MRKEICFVLLISILFIDAACAPNIGKLRSNGEIDKLISALSHHDSDIRSNAAAALGELEDPRAVEPLISLLSDDNREVRLAATEALGSIGDPTATSALINLLADESSYVRYSVSVALEKIGEPAVMSLIGALSHEESIIQAEAALVLVRIGDPAIEPLIAALSSDHETTVMNVITILGKIGNPLAMDALLSLVDKNTSDIVLHSATDAMIQLGDPPIEAIIDKLNNVDPGQRLISAKALGFIGDAQAVEPLILLLQDEDLHVRHGAYLALDEIGEESCEYLISKICELDKTGRNLAQQLLESMDLTKNAMQYLLPALEGACDALQGSIEEVIIKMSASKGDEAVIQEMTAMLDDLDAESRQKTIEIIGMLGTPMSLNVLIDLLEDTDANVRSTAAIALGNIVDPNAFEPLTFLLQDPDENVRIAVVKALSEYGEQGMDSLLSAMLDTSANVRFYVVHQVNLSAINFYSSKAAEIIILAFSDEDSQVRAEASSSFLHDEDSRIADLLVNALQDKDVAVRLSAAHTLTIFGDLRVVNPLLIMFQNHIYQGNCEYVLKLDNDLLMLGPKVDSLNELRRIESALISALGVCGNDSMVEAFKLSGNRILAKAANEWTKARGYQLVIIGGDEGSSWGSYLDE